MKKLIATLLSTITTVFATESQIDLKIDADPNDLHKKSSFNVMSTTSANSEDHSVLISPEMSLYTTGTIDFSLTGTHRHRLGSYIFGHSIFFDRSNMGFVSFDQLGTGFDVLTKRMEARLNYYHPICYGKKMAVKAAKWLDAEVFFNTPYFGVGTGPIYNIDMKFWALHSRLVIPMRTCSFTLGGICGEKGYAQAFISVSFHLFRPAHSDLLIAPPCHTSKSNIYYKSAFKMDTQGNLIDIYDQRFVDYISQIEDEVSCKRRYLQSEE